MPKNAPRARDWLKPRWGKRCALWPPHCSRDERHRAMKWLILLMAASAQARTSPLLLLLEAQQGALDRAASHAREELRALERVVCLARAMRATAHSAADSASEKRQQPEWALQQREDMQDRSLAHDVTTYSATDSAWEKGQQSVRALQLQDAMQVRGLAPNVNTDSAAISACEKRQQPMRALRLPEDMQDRRAAPNMITYSAANSACEKGQQPVRALRLPEDMQDRRAAPTMTHTVQPLALARRSSNQWRRCN
jgi:hypothetical protein